MRYPFTGRIRQAVRLRRVPREVIADAVCRVRLRGLERDGLVDRTVHPTNPPQVEYALTKLGQTLLEPVRVLAVWAQGHRGDVMKARARYDRASTPKG
jgi:DNA-binding HxlR family transcriptional regulator